MKLRIGSATMGLLFLVSVALQYNDPDPLPWMAVYGAAALVCLGYAWRGRMRLVFPLVVLVVALAWGAFIATHIEGTFEWHHLAETMHAGTPQIEESRESLGLLIVAVWMVVVAVAARSTRTRAHV